MIFEEIFLCVMFSYINMLCVYQNMAGNYRQISVLLTISKIMERILYDQLYDYFTKFGHLGYCQFGFRKFISTTTALLDCTNEWYMNLDRKKFNLVVLIDLKKALLTIKFY